MFNHPMFTHSAHLYDLQYSFKDYNAEAQRVLELIRQHGAGGGRSLLDVACGTGLHDRHFADAGFEVVGVDLDEVLLEIARERVPEGEFVRGDMAEFELGCRFDAVVCLFSAIGYVVTVSRLRATLGRFAAHVKPGGVVLVEPWLTPDVFQEGHVHQLVVDQPELKMSRMNISRIEAGEENLVTPLDFFFQVATPQGVERFEERHALGLFTKEQYQEAFEAAGLETSYDEVGLMGRGLWIGVSE